MTLKRRFGDPNWDPPNKCETPMGSHLNWQQNSSGQLASGLIVFLDKVMTMQNRQTRSKAHG